MHGSPQPALLTEPSRSLTLDARVAKLLAETGGAIAFNGLRRQLAAHPESLTRALRRLERGGVIEHRSAGYVLTSAPMEGVWERRRTATMIGAIKPPNGYSESRLIGRLAGRWFGALRWVGLFDRPGAPQLAWSLEGAREILLLEFRADSVGVLIDEPMSGPLSEPVNAAARELLFQVASVLREHPIDLDERALWLSPQAFEPRIAS